MFRWIFAAVLLLSAAPAVLADGHRGHGHGHAYGHYRGYSGPRVYFGANAYFGSPVYYGPPAYSYYGPPAYYGPRYSPWVPGYAVVPPYYRARFRPVPMELYPQYGPVPYGCRRAYLDGYVVDYRPSNYFVVNFARGW